MKASLPLTADILVLSAHVTPALCEGKAVLLLLEAMKMFDRNSDEKCRNSDTCEINNMTASNSKFEAMNNFRASLFFEIRGPHQIYH